MVARSWSALGPFEKRVINEWGGSAILEASERRIAPGHNAIVTDKAGQDWIVYRAIRPDDRFQPAVHAVKRPMPIDRIEWRDGWPTGAGGAPPADNEPAPAN